MLVNNNYLLLHFRLVMVFEGSKAFKLLGDTIAHVVSQYFFILVGMSDGKERGKS